MTSIYPVVMCGGVGSRLWPASRPSRPKQFIPLAGNRSLFQDAVERVAPLVQEGGELLIVGGVSHQRTIIEQLDRLGVQATILLEPEGRDSAAAMTAAALWTKERAADAVNLFVASDHHIPDNAAFRAAVRDAEDAASRGRIVTLGVVPTEPSSAYGYIAPAGPGLSDVAAFVEKPDRQTAAAYIAAGHLWNSGNFIVRSDILVQEIRERQAAVGEAVLDALEHARIEGRSVFLGAGFKAAPKISIDYAVMEKTERAAVLPVKFAWSDLGAWDAVAASGEGETGAHVLEDVHGCFVRSVDGIVVAALGVRDLAIIAERDAVLVCSLDRSQDVKKVVDRLKIAAPHHVDFPQTPSPSLTVLAERFADWMRLRALPLWTAYGQAAGGGFLESLTLKGRSVDADRRARVQARQIQVFAAAEARARGGRWLRLVADGLDYLDLNYLRTDGCMRTRLDRHGVSLDETAMLYDQAFLLFALAAAERVCEHSRRKQAEMVRDHILATNPASHGFVENGSHPFQSNAHMHLLEASLAWEDITGDAAWQALSDRIATLAITRFIDPTTGALREFFDADWSPAAGDDGRLVEPGHQFEWAWLLSRYGRARGIDQFLECSAALYDWGMKGLDDRRLVVIDAMNDDASIRSARARLWPQTEWLKAALILAQAAGSDGRHDYLADAARALRAIDLYLTPDGLWHDKMLEDGSFIDEPAPASSFYHLFAAWEQLATTGPALDFVDEERFRLG